MLAVLSNHTYQFGGETRLQKDGGPIGLELAGSMARVTMIWWDRQFLTLASVNNVCLYFYMRYVDDENMAGEPLEAGTRWEVGPWASGLGGRMVLREDKILEDLEMPEDARSMGEIAKMGSSISHMIQLEEDFPTKNSDSKLPILDLKVWVEEEKEEGGDQTSARVKLYYQYYRKPMANWLLMPATLPCPAR